MVLPSRLSGRGAGLFLLILGGYPTGLKTVIFSWPGLLISTVDSARGVVTILFIVAVLGSNIRGRHYRAAGRARTSTRLQGRRSLRLKTRRLEAKVQPSLRRSGTTRDPGTLRALRTRSSTAATNSSWPKGFLIRGASRKPCGSVSRP